MLGFSNFALVGDAANQGSLIFAILEITLVCAAAGLLAQLLRMPFVPILLVAGILAGPHVLTLVQSVDRFSEISHFAVIILLFGIGLEIDLKSNFRAFVKECLVGAIACVFCTLSIATALLSFNISWQESLTLGMALSLSSTAVVLRIIVKSRQLKTTFGSLSLSILVTQDILVLGMLASLPLLAASLAPSVLETAATVAYSYLDYFKIVLRMLGVVLIIVLLRYLLPKLMKLSLRERTSDVVLFVGSAIALIITQVVSTLGFSYEIGAFVAGLVLAGTQFRYQLGSQLAPFREFFLAIFFLTVGMQLDPVQLWSNLGLVVAMVLILLGCKIVGIYLSCRLMGIAGGVSILTAFSLAQAGEFGLILIQEANRLKLVSPVIGDVVIGSIILTLIGTPSLLWLGRKAGHISWFIRSDGRNNSSLVDNQQAVPPEVILVGFGPSGRRVGKFLISNNIPFHVIDLSLTTVKTLKSQGISASLGDATQSEVLEHAGLAEAEVLVVAIPDETAALRVCAVAKGINKNIHVVVRLVHEAKVSDALLLELEAPVVEELVVGDSLSATLEAILNRGSINEVA